MIFFSFKGVNGGFTTQSGRLPAPTDLAINATGSDIAPTWDAVVGADHYEYNIGAGWIVLGNVLTVEINDLADAEYLFRVRAVDAIGIKGLATGQLFEVDEVPDGSGSFAGSESLFAGSENHYAGAQ